MQTANTSETPAVNVDTRQTDDSDGSVHGNIECIAWWWASQFTTAAGDSNRQHAAHKVCRKVDVPVLDLRRLKRLVRHFILKDVTLRVVPATGDIGLRGVKTKCHPRPADASWTQAMRSIPREQVQQTNYGTGSAASCDFQRDTGNVRGQRGLEGFLKELYRQRDGLPENGKTVLKCLCFFFFV